MLHAIPAFSGALRKLLGGNANATAAQDDASLGALLGVGVGSSADAAGVLEKLFSELIHRTEYDHGTAMAGALGATRWTVQRSLVCQSCTHESTTSSSPNLVHVAVREPGTVNVLGDEWINLLRQALFKQPFEYCRRCPNRRGCETLTGTTRHNRRCHTSWRTLLRSSRCDWCFGDYLRPLPGPTCLQLPRYWRDVQEASLHYVVGTHSFY
ncbi:unnamed protein product [Ectocarpus sp. 13 AM-2016]